MAVKIVADSSCDLSRELKENMNIDIAPLILQLGDKNYLDDESLDIRDYVKAMGESENSPKTSCPSPEDYMKRYQGDESIFVVTLSNKLSGSYNSAILAKNIFLEEVGQKFIHVFDSLSASAGETLIALKINELAKKNLSDIEILEKVTSYIKEMKTFFLLESLDHLAKAGRLNPIVAKLANMLSIKSIMGATEEGTIKLVEKTRGYKKAFKRFVEIIGEEGSNLEEKVLGIAHCNALDKALNFKDEILRKYNFKDIVIVEMGGLSSTYADDGGIVVAF
ncbi:DegV family protein with EDD domain [Clostridium pascui]|uniref:DegV family protein n=1 Tax=Clostridium pascui TaxID=46609 RepID=UPI00195667C4|nr:DegV family protein [Clostridium pascui]MBM7872121.1 DegV family protein with EDD domain [Clostridium pascui]